MPSSRFIVLLVCFVGSSLLLLYSLSRDELSQAASLPAVSLHFHGSSPPPLPSRLLRDPLSQPAASTTTTAAAVAAPVAAAPLPSDGAGKDPMTVSEVQQFLSHYLKDLHVAFQDRKSDSVEDIWDSYFQHTYRTLYHWDKDYMSRLPPRRSDSSIFMSVASYRDENCLPTLTQAYSKASNPSNLYVGLVQQNCLAGCTSGVLDGGKMESVPPDDDCYQVFCESSVGAPHCEAGRVRVLKVNETESLGPYAARFFASKLWHGEPWYMQIDSHMTFKQGWDEKSVDMLSKAPSKKPVITHYPPDHKANLDRASIGSRICDPFIADSDIEYQIVRLEGSVDYDRVDVGVPRFAPFVAAGYYVAHSSFLQEVPLDPFLPWIFMGEEISMSARLWTAGYDLFSPSEPVMGHVYVRRHKPKFWETFQRVFRNGSFNRVQMMVLRRVKNTLGYPEDASDFIMPRTLLTAIDEYGMGKERKLADYMKMVGIDVVAKQTKKQNWCHKGVPPPGFEQFKDLYLGGN